MHPRYKLGKREARPDARFPRLSHRLLSPLPPPPPSVTWWKTLENQWTMLGNDEVSNCVFAAIGHCIQQETTIAGQPQVMTTAEAKAVYSAVTGYVDGDPSTDLGTYLMGQGGAIEWWCKNGILAAGVLNTLKLFLQITQPDPVEWRQGINLFGGMLTGIQLPASIVATDAVPFLWHDPSGAVEGGHEIWIDGYEESVGERVYDLISWGGSPPKCGRFRATEAFLQKVVDEVVVVYDPASMNARGVNADNLDVEQVTADMQALAGT